MMSHQQVTRDIIYHDQVSASHGHNVDTLLVGIVKQIRLKEVELANRNSMAR